MNDTSTKFAALVERHHARLSALQRMQIAAGMYDTARRIAWSAVPSGLSEQDLGCTTSGGCTGTSCLKRRTRPLRAAGDLDEVNLAHPVQRVIEVVLRPHRGLLHRRGARQKVARLCKFHSIRTIG